MGLPMTFIETIPEEQASGALARLYEQERADDGYVCEHHPAFSHRPEVLAGWNEFLKTIGPTWSCGATS